MSYKEEYGDTNVPLNNPKWKQLGVWVKEQRRRYNLIKEGRPSHMTEERVAALEES